MPGGQHWVSSQDHQLKESFVSPSSWVHVAAFLFHHFLSILSSVPLCHVCLWCLCRRAAEYEATMCQVGVSNPDHPWSNMAYCINAHDSFLFLQLLLKSQLKGSLAGRTNLISLFSLVSFTVEMESNTISLAERQIDTKDGEEGTRRTVGDKERVFFSETQVHQIRSRCVRHVSAAG